MSDEIKINPTHVAQTSTAIQNQINERRQKLLETYQKITLLSSAWKGKSAEAASQTFDSFSPTRLQPHFDTLQDYTAFLHSTVAQGYDLTEKINTDLAESFK